MNKFINPNDTQNIQIKALIKQWILEKLGFNETNATVEIEENYCNDAHCLHADTLITVTNTQEVLYFKATKPLTYIRKNDIQNLQSVKLRPFLHKH